MSGETAPTTPYRAPADVPEGQLRLHQNENLFEVQGTLPSPKITAADLRQYPTGAGRRLVQALSARYGVAADGVFIESGSAALLNAIFAQCSNLTGTAAVLATPTWPYFSRLLDGLHLRHVEAPQTILDGAFHYDRDAIIAAATTHAAATILVASPNNPTGNRIAYADMMHIAQACPGSLVVLDEAYWGFAAPDPMPVPELLAACPNLVLVRTFSKAFGLANLRIGFALAGEGARRVLRRNPVPFGISDFAQDMAIARLHDDAYQAAVREACTQSRDLIMRELKGFHVYPSEANFVLVRAPQGMGRQVYDKLAERGIVVSLVDQTVLPDHLRITLADLEPMQRLIAALSA